MSRVFLKARQVACWRRLRKAPSWAGAWILRWQTFPLSLCSVCRMQEAECSRLSAHFRDNFPAFLNALLKCGDS